MAAAGGDLPRRVTVASAAPATAAVDNAAYLSSFPGSAQRDAGSGHVADDRRRAQTEPIFRSLFQAGERTQPISPAVQELWGNGSSLTSASDRLSAQRPKSARRGRSICSATATARSAADRRSRVSAAAELCRDEPQRSLVALRSSLDSRASKHRRSRVQHRTRCAAVDGDAVVASLTKRQ